MSFSFVREKGTCAVAVLALLLSAVCTGLLINLLCRNHKEAPDQLNNKGKVCLPCNALPDDKAVSEKWSQQEDGKSCCTHDLTELSAVLGMVLKRKQTSEEPLPSHDPHRFSLGRASAHKVLVPSENFLKNTDKPETEENDPLYFKHDRHVTLWEHANNVDVTREGFRILVSGWYNVYSNVMFRSDSNKKCKDHKKQTWEHHVIKMGVRDRSSSGPILQSYHTCCDTCSRHKETSFTGGVFYLEADDFLHVEVTDEELISYNNYASYMGVTMLGDEHSSSSIEVTLSR